MKDANYETLKLESGEYLTIFNEKYKKRKPYSLPQHVVRAAIPGTIISVLVKEGQEVKRGDALCILDSMKMNNIICSDENGIVSRVFVKSKDSIGKDAQMIELKPLQ